MCIKKKSYKQNKEKICIGKLTKSTLSTGHIIGIIRI